MTRMISLSILLVAGLTTITLMAAEPKGKVPANKGDAEVHPSPDFKIVWKGQEDRFIEVRVKQTTTSAVLVMKAHNFKDNSRANSVLDQTMQQVVENWQNNVPEYKKKTIKETRREQDTANKVLTRRVEFGIGEEVVARKEKREVGTQTIGQAEEPNVSVRQTGEAKKVLLRTPKHFTPGGSGNSNVDYLAISSDGTLLASGGRNGVVTIRLRSFPALKYQKSIDVSPSNLAISGDNRTIIAVADKQSECQVTYWSLPDAHLTKAVRFPYYSHFWAISPNEKVAVCYLTESPAKGVPEGVAVVSLPEGNIVRSINTLASVMAISPGGQLLATYHDDVLLWSLPDGKQLAFRKKEEQDVNGLAFTHDGKGLIAAMPGEVKIWSVPDGRLLTWFEWDKRSFSSAALGPSGRLLACGGSDGNIYLWSVPDGQFKGVTVAQPGDPSGAAYKRHDSGDQPLPKRKQTKSR